MTGSGRWRPGSGGAGHAPNSPNSPGANIGINSLAAATIETTGSGNIVLNGSGGTSALSLGTGRWLIYSTDPSDNTGEFATYDWRRYAATYDHFSPGLVTQAGNGFIYSAPASLTVTLSDASKTYDGNTAISTAGLTVASAVDGHGGDQASITLTGTNSGGTVLSPDVGNGRPVYGATLASVTGSADVTTATLTDHRRRSRQGLWLRRSHPDLCGQWSGRR